MQSGRTAIFLLREHAKDRAEPTDHMWKRFAVRNERFRLVENSLYDMKADPGQTTDVAGKFPEIVKSMKEAMKNFGRRPRW